jgi:UDP-N-acetylglucosamine diphosphorylase/glucosamine-1-phosphate N-acetyltransferase
MQTVLLAAGRGTRMAPLTASTAKPMLPVADRPLVAHTADAAVAAGATRLVVVVGYDEDTVREYFRDEFDTVPVTCVTQAEQRGTADAVRTAVPALEDGRFAVLNGDALYDVQGLTALYENGTAVGSFRVDEPSSYGVLHTDVSATRVTGVTEKPADPSTDLVNAGAYMFPGEATHWLDVSESARGELELTDVLERACRTVDVTPVRFDQWLDVGRPWELLAANEWKLGELDRRIDGEVHPDADIRGDVVVEAGATVDAGVVIEGPALVREGASVGPNAYVRGATLIDRDAKVGHSVEVKNSVFSRGATAGHLSYVGDSVLGEEVNLGAGTTVANLRHDDAPVELPVNGERVSTGRRKFGVVLGDGTKTGIDTSLNAGVKLPACASTAPGETVLFGSGDPRPER